MSVTIKPQNPLKTYLWLDCWNWILPVRLRCALWNFCFDCNYDHRNMKRRNHFGW